jgi:DNA-binding transcriptional LysR family regulator
MKIEQYLYAIEIADTGSFSQAARNLYVSQPNLSYAIKQLEQRIGFSLFKRTPTGVIPTIEGRAFIEHFRVLKCECEQVEEMLKYKANVPRLSLRVGTLNCSRTIPIFSDIIKQYIGNPINFSFINYSSIGAMIPLVENCQVDFGIIGALSPYLRTVMLRLENSSIEYHILGDMPISALVGRTNPLYNGSDTISIQDLYSHTIIQYSDTAIDPSNSMPYVMGLSAHNFGEVHVNSSQLYYNTIQTTPVVGFVGSVPEVFSRYNEWENIRILRIKDCPITAQFGWIKLQRYTLPDIAAELLKSIESLF